jgi:hypothetical protein
MAKAPFKMKSSPTKATLADFFKGIKGKKTDMSKLRATQKRMSRGESEWQHKTKGLAKAGLEARKNAVSYSAKSMPSVDKQIEAADKRFGEGVQINASKIPSAQEMINTAYKGANNDWAKASKNAMDMYGVTLNKLIDDRDSPVEKKSPYKKGIGKYAKKAKGNRGYKMKRK